MQVFLQIVAFSLQTDGSGRPVLTKGKRPTVTSITSFEVVALNFRSFDMSRTKKIVALQDRTVLQKNQLISQVSIKKSFSLNKTPWYTKRCP